jgi:hypothetical protein
MHPLQKKFKINEENDKTTLLCVIKIQLFTFIEA